MIPIPVRPAQARRLSVPSVLRVGALCLPAAAGLMGGAATAQDRGGNRCALYGADFTDIGNGTCARVVRQYASPYGEAGGQHVRVDLGNRAASSDSRSSDPSAWSAGGTANAALRSDGLGMLPGAADAQHLRVPGGLFSH